MAEEVSEGKTKATSDKSRGKFGEGAELCQDTEKKTMVSEFLAKKNIFFSCREIIIKRILEVQVQALYISGEKRGHF